MTQSSSTIGCIILAGPLGEKTLALSKIDHDFIQKPGEGFRSPRSQTGLQYGKANRNTERYARLIKRDKQDTCQVSKRYASKRAMLTKKIFTEISINAQNY
jgi:hypothetical protein